MTFRGPRVIILYALPAPNGTSYTICFSKNLCSMGPGFSRFRLPLLDVFLGKILQVDLCTEFIFSIVITDAPNHQEIKQITDTFVCDF